MQQKDAPVACGLQRLRYGHGRLPARQPDIEDVTASLAYRRVVIGNQTKHVQRLGKLTKPSRFRYARGTNDAADPAGPPMKLSLQIAEIPALERVFFQIRELTGRSMQRRQTRPLGLIQR
jgi:hypothetical protein